MPRPKLPPGRAASALIGIRLTRERKRAYAKAARKEKLTLTEWLLKAADFHLQGKGHFTTRDLEMFAGVLNSAYRKIATTSQPDTPPRASSV